ncbi:MAG: DUF192 domain-containing protein [Gammaproteobacteria bacterium]|nr:DUF192 domain-containing protein [Gammaproteobacteria bacterium]
MLIRLCSMLLALSVSSCEFVNRNELVAARVDGIELQITIAMDDVSRGQGLMGRQSLEMDEGMLLVYPREGVISLWMLNTHLPLDVGFFDRNRVMVGSLSMEPDGGKKIHSSPKPAMYALEMSRGWFERNRIGVGARLQLPSGVRGE